ncbi:5-dehydro-4-deoxy-D-glucuronate isomerase [Microbacterium aurum]
MTFRRLYSTHPEDVDALGTEALRDRFVVAGLFGSDGVSWAYAHDDRMLIGGATVVEGRPLRLTAPEELAAEYLLERRELGIVGLEGRIRIDADRERYSLGAQDVLYLPRGTRDVELSGEGVAYLVSAPAHRAESPALATRDDVEALELGSAEGANERTIRKYIHADGIRSNQLVLGITTLAPGSVWNTMPPHVHARRTEIYLYDGLGDRTLVHLLGRPDRSRHVVLRDREAVVSPPWSIHTGAGTGAYSFVWAMAGENVDYTDVVAIDEKSLR